jgi:hypothetical protein
VLQILQNTLTAESVQRPEQYHVETTPVGILKMLIRVTTQGPIELFLGMSTTPISRFQKSILFTWL